MEGENMFVDGAVVRTVFNDLVASGRQNLQRADESINVQKRWVDDVDGWDGEGGGCYEEISSAMFTDVDLVASGARQAIDDFRDARTLVLDHVPEGAARSGALARLEEALVSTQQVKTGRGSLNDAEAAHAALEGALSTSSSLTGPFSGNIGAQLEAAVRASGGQVGPGEVSRARVAERLADAVPESPFLG